MPRRAITLVVLAILGAFLDAAPVGAASNSATVSGTAKISGAPSTFQNSGFYVQACPVSIHFTDGCVGGATATPSGTPGHYAIVLKPVGKWLIGVYYYAEHGQLINGPTVALTVRAGQKASQNLAVAYETPAAKGKVLLTGAPKNFLEKAYMGVQGCPGATFEWACKGLTEAYENILPGHAYSIDLTPGKWMIAAYYHPHNSTATFVGKPVAVTASAGKTTTVNVTIAYQGV